MPRRRWIEKIADLPTRELFIIIALATVVVAVSVHNALWIGAIHGSEVVRYNTIHLPLYGFLRVPFTWKDEEIAGRFGVDFLQVYAGARRLVAGGPLYDRRYDFFGRLPTYPPFTHFLYAPLATRWSASSVVQIHLGLQVAVLLLSTFAVLGARRWGEVLASWVIMLGFLFASPVGLAWAERGQFDLYTAAAFIFALSAILQQRYSHFLLSGGLAAIKWSSLPFLFVIIAVHLSRGGPGRRRRWVHAASVAGVLIASVAAFPGHAVPYLSAIRTLELVEGPSGISLGQVFPAWLYKPIPLVLVAVAIPFLRWTRARWGGDYEEVTRVAGWVGACILLVMYGTNCFDYRALALLAFVPTFLVWVGGSGEDWSPRARAFRNLVILLFPLVLAVMLRLFLRDLLFMQWIPTVWLFIGVALAYFALAVIVPLGDGAGRRPSDEPV